MGPPGTIDLCYMPSSGMSAVKPIVLGGPTDVGSMDENAGPGSGHAFGDIYSYGQFL